MIGIKNIPIVRKIALIIAVFGFLAVQTVIYATGAILSIDNAYQTAFRSEGAVVDRMAQAHVALTRIVSAIADLGTSHDDQGRSETLRRIATLREAFTLAIDAATKADLQQAGAIEDFAAQVRHQIDQTCEKAVALGSRAGFDAPTNHAAEVEFASACGPGFTPLFRIIDTIVQTARVNETAALDRLHATSRGAVVTTYVAVLGSLVFILVCSYAAVRIWISDPLRRLAGSMGRVAKGDLSCAVTGIERHDEIGSMARAVQVFKDNAVQLKALEAIKREVDAERDRVVAALAEGLDGLAKGDLTRRIMIPFTSDYRKLREDFNNAADSLHHTLRGISQTSEGLRMSSKEIAQASDHLARRTEQQATNVEETASALRTITQTVSKTAASAEEVSRIVAASRRTIVATDSAVQESVDAMGTILESSRQIGRVIGLIDELAARTKMLSLNATIEAAGAGEAGRGFAVVAQEVRNLAERSADAAREINTLVGTSTLQVESGVKQVAKTGKALREIVAQVSTIDALVHGISVSSAEQSESLTEVNTAVGQIDQVVQENAAMVEESNAAANAMQLESQVLTTMVGRFGIDNGKDEPKPRGRVAARADNSSPPASRGDRRARVPELAATTDWREF